MDVHVLPALNDNYMYLIVDKSSKDAAVVDPVEPLRVIDLVQSKNLNLKSILTTHHHWDHAGGNLTLLEKMPHLDVFGGEDRVDGVKNIIKHGDKFNLGQLQIECLFTPCHTRGHICYKVSADDDIALFTGDTLFIAGCGKFFEGTAEQMYNALIKTIGILPDQTKIYCGHEYTLNNLKFAQHIEPDNTAVKDKIKFAEACKQQKRPTVPSTIGEEKLHNPFMRVHEAKVQEKLGKNDPIETMAALREEKNNFKAPK